VSAANGVDVVSAARTVEADAERCFGEAETRQFNCKIERKEGCRSSGHPEGMCQDIVKVVRVIVVDVETSFDHFVGGGGGPVSG